LPIDHASYSHFIEVSVVSNLGAGFLALGARERGMGIMQRIMSRNKKLAFLHAIVYNLEIKQRPGGSFYGYQTQWDLQNGIRKAK